jgi:hypothetical protein
MSLLSLGFERPGLTGPRSTSTHRTRPPDILSPQLGLGPPLPITLVFPELMCATAQTIPELPFLCQGQRFALTRIPKAWSVQRSPQ